MTQPLVLNIPGLYNSGPQHWQTHWERQFPQRFRRVQQRDWNTPRAQDWMAELDRAVAEAGPEVLLTAHSTACCLVAMWARDCQRTVRGALIVGPSDTEAPSYPAGPSGFAPMPLTRIPFATILVTSTNDPYVSLERAKQFAKAWGSQFIALEKAGHINADAGFGPWPEGLKLLEQL